MVLLDFSIFPVGSGTSLSAYVARSIDIVRKSGLPYHFHSMGTTIEGEYDEVMSVVRACFDDLRLDCPRIACTIKIDYRSGRGGRLESKVKRVEERLDASSGR